MIKHIASAVAALVFGVSANAATELVVNGGFENPSIANGSTITFSAGSFIGNGWKTTNASTDVDLVDTAGNQALFLNQGSDDVRQVLNGVAAGSYLFKFDFSGSAPGSVTKIGSFLIRQGGNSILWGDLSEGFGSYSNTFSLAGAGNVTVLFSGAGAGARSLFLDNVSVTAVPEPETYAMMLAGLGALGFMARRRRA